MSEIDKFNRNVGQIRILLNKLSEGNFEVIQDKLLKDFEYTPSLLYELMKIIFMKSTTEQSFMEIYVKLCVTLFKKFNDKENVEMNFRKLLLTLAWMKRMTHQLKPTSTSRCYTCTTRPRSKRD